MRTLLLGTFCCLLLSTAAQANTDSRPEASLQELRAALTEQKNQLDRQQALLEEQRQRLKEQEGKLDAQRGELQQLLSKFEAFDQAAPLQPATLAEMRAGRDESKPGGANLRHDTLQKAEEVPEEVASERKSKKQERQPEIAAYIEEGGILLPRGTLVVTPEIEYLNSSATRVAIEGFSVIPALNIGLFEVSELNRDTVGAAVNARLGVTNRFEIDTKIPFLYRQDSTRNRPIGVGASTDILSRAEGYGVGDIEVGAHYQINDGKEGWPFFIGNLRFKSQTGTSPFDVDIDPGTGLQTELPTGSGFYALQPSITAIYPTDPGVFYGNLGYLMNFEEDVGGTIGTIDPGDSVGASLGMSVALNDASSFSLGYSHNMVFKTRQNGNVISNSRNLQVGTLDTGFAHRLNDRTSLNLNVSTGVTEDAPDVNVIFRVPVKFDVF